jgi:hypothetical protein
MSGPERKAEALHAVFSFFKLLHVRIMLFFKLRKLFFPLHDIPAEKKKKTGMAFEDPKKTGML